MYLLLRCRSSVPAFYGRPPGSPSNSAKIFPSRTVTFSPTLRPRKSFSRNTYETPRKCCKQKTYAKAKSFRCNTYKKQGVGVPGIQPPQPPLVHQIICGSFFSCIYELPIFHLLSFDIHSWNGGCTPLRLHFLPSCATMSAARCPKSKPRGTK